MGDQEHTMKTLTATILALGLFAGAAQAASQGVFTQIDQTAPRAGTFEDLSRTAPRGGTFQDLNDTAPRAGTFEDLKDTAPLGEEGGAR
jgi:hypothetical protein